MPSRPTFAKTTFIGDTMIRLHWSMQGGRAATRTTEMTVATLEEGHQVARRTWIVAFLPILDEPGGLSGGANCLHRARRASHVRRAGVAVMTISSSARWRTPAPTR